MALVSISYSEPGEFAGQVCPEASVSDAITKSSTTTSHWVRHAASQTLGFTRFLLPVSVGFTLFSVAFTAYHLLFH